VTPAPASNPSGFLVEQREVVLDAAADALRHRAVRHYAAEGDDAIRGRLERLYDGIVLAVAARDAGELVVYADELAVARFHAGYDLGEVQAAFNALEESIWACAAAELRSDDYAAVIGLVSSVVGAARDALARRYVVLATKEHLPSLDVEALFAGTERA